MASNAPIVVIVGRVPPPPPPPPPVCIDGDAEILMESGAKKLRDVVPGDRVLGMYGDIVTVVAVHSCIKTPDHMFVIRNDDGRSLVITKNHAVWARGAVEDWHVPDTDLWNRECEEYEKLHGGVGFDFPIERLEPGIHYHFGMVDGWFRGVMMPFTDEPMRVYSIELKGRASPGYYANGFLVEAEFWEFEDYINKPWDPPRRGPNSADRYWHKRRANYK